MWPELKRKAFHLTALVYVVGLVFLERRLFLFILAVLFLGAAASEWARLTVPRFNEWVSARFGGLLRESEKRHFSGVFWMLLGVTSTAVLIEPLPVAVTVLLYLILGDGVASLVGMRLGGPHWPFSSKRLSGSAACFFVCFLVGQTLLRPFYGWNGIVLGALAAAAAELGLVPLNDNFAIPLVSSLVMLICYHLRPFSF